MVNEAVILLEGNEALNIAIDARIVSLRWDLIEWALVVDIDYKVKVDLSASSTGRAWLIFDDITDVSVDFDQARIPNGISSIHGITSTYVDQIYTDFFLFVLAPKYDMKNNMQKNPLSEVKLRAKKLRVVKSKRTSVFGQFGPNFNERQSLASDPEFLAAIIS